MKLSLHSQKKLLIWTKTLPWVNFLKSNTHSKNAVVVISKVVQTSTKHGKSTFFQNLFSKKMSEIKLTFRSKIPFMI
jgi:hypothetical protein